ncbi:sugar ABC transporter substrate-binding protein [Arthrobacter sp. KNU40]|uniref:sugar ABC transporter substrate-binding protein n=1 Tax=Arthrobacter sp. KNU40 TaxID=3447965 RepID=UPI003F5FD89F
MYNPRLGRLAIAAAGVLVALSMSACSAESVATSAPQGSSNFKLPESAQKLLDEAMAAPPAWKPPASSPTPAKGKFVVSMPCAQAAVTCARISDAFVAAAKALGWRTETIDPQGDPLKMQAAVQSAITQGASGMFAGASAEQIGPALLAKAREAGIVMMNFGGDNDPTGPAGWSATMNVDFGPPAPALAAYVAKASNGGAHVLVLDNSEYDIVHNGVTSFKQALEQDCPSCNVVDVMDTAVADMDQSLTARVQAELQAHPEINYINVTIDAIGSEAATAIQQLGLAGKVKLVGTDGLPQTMQFVDQGVQAATYARSWDLMGWGVADEMNRIFNQEPVAKDSRGFVTENYPTQLIDKSNLPADITKNWSGGAAYEAMYRNLWGVK